jgi:hypothetical protein
VQLGVRGRVTSWPHYLVLSPECDTLSFQDKVSSSEIGPNNRITLKSYYEVRAMV